MEQNNKTEIKEVFQEIAGLENNKIWSTLKGLTIRPGELISAYVNGTEQRVLNPIAYYFFVFAICTYLGNASGFNAAVYKETKDFALQLANDYNFQMKESTVETVERSNRFLDSDAVNSLIFLPFALFLQWIIFRKFKSSFKANAWFNLFINGHFLLLSVPLEVLIWRLTGNSIPISIPLFIYIIWATKQFYGIKFIPASLYCLIYLIANMIIGSMTSGVSAAMFTLLNHWGL